MRIRVKIEDALVAMDVFNDRSLELPKIGQPLDIHFPKEACWLT